METPGAAMLPGSRRSVLVRTKQQTREYSAQWRASHPGYGAAHARDWASRHPQYADVVRARRRLRAFEVLGGVCEICGMSDPMVLEINHRYNDGGAHRKEIGTGGTALQLWILNNEEEAKQRLQLLCANCHVRLTSVFNKVEGYQDTRRRVKQGVMYPY